MELNRPLDQSQYYMNGHHFHESTNAHWYRPSVFGFAPHIILSLQKQSTSVLLKGPLNILLLCFPIALVSYLTGGTAMLTCFSALLAVAPIAERLGYLTEQLTFYTSDSTSALLNITFGNATEFLLSVSALKRGLVNLVRLSLLGSVMSNLLLVVGTSFFLNGMRFSSKPKQSYCTYDRYTAQINMTLLMIASSTLIYPTLLTTLHDEQKVGENQLSRGSSVILICFYGALLYFQLCSHKHLYEQVGPISRDETEYEALPFEDSEVDKDINSLNLNIGDGVESSSPILRNIKKIEPDLSFGYIISWLLVTTASVAVLSECIADSIQQAAIDAGISSVFISAVMIPVAANAAEHFSALLFASKGKLDLTLNVAVGSCLQISLGVIPSLVLLGWMIGVDLTLNFGRYEVTALFVSVLALAIVVKDGQANYLIGMILTGFYMVVAFGFFVHVNSSLS